MLLRFEIAEAGGGVSLCGPLRNHVPWLLVAVETDTRSAQIGWCSCFRLKGRKLGTANARRKKKPAEKSNGACENTNIKKFKKEIGKGNFKWEHISIQRGKWESREVS